MFAQHLARNHLTDKVFWHHYDDFYVPIFKNLKKAPSRICEIGIYRGDSLRWLRDQIPEAQIFAADILTIQENWPIHNNISYFQLDQSNEIQLRNFFQLSKPDLIIEDGSHHPTHQALSLMLGIEALKNHTSEGIYILEDVHTSHPLHPQMKSKLRWFSKNRFVRRDFQGNSLTLLLAIEHLKSHGKVMTFETAKKLSNDLFSTSQVFMLSKNIKKILLYRRTRLPDHCHACGSFDFDYHKLKCQCNEEIFSDTDSMTFAIFT
jgi:hypothetical protein